MTSVTVSRAPAGWGVPGLPFTPPATTPATGRHETTGAGSGNRRYRVPGLDAAATQTRARHTLHGTDHPLSRALTGIETHLDTITDHTSDLW